MVKWRVDRYRSFPTIENWWADIRKMDDLYVIFLEKLAADVTAIHPHRWLLREAHELP
jgi:hypothetical protein